MTISARQVGDLNSTTRLRIGRRRGIRRRDHRPVRLEPSSRSVCALSDSSGGGIGMRGRSFNRRNVCQARPGEGAARDSSARISSPYVSRRHGPKSVMCANSPCVRGTRRARSQSAVRGRMTSDSTPRALARVTLSIRVPPASRTSNQKCPLLVGYLRTRNGGFSATFIFCYLGSTIKLYGVVILWGEPGAWVTPVAVTLNTYSLPASLLIAYK